MSAKDNDIKKQVRDRYARAAKTSSSCCGPVSSPCCGGQSDVSQGQASRMVGYSPEELAAVPEDANLGLGCGNPTALAGLKPGETVLDLGSGAGIDCFLAAKKVGPSGRVIGVDMTPDMIDRARENARKSGVANVEFRLGEIENLPVADNTVNVIISNCVINLSTDKPSVFREAYRVLKPGGRLAISDVVATAELPAHIRNDLTLYSACAAGAAYISDLERWLAEAGFAEIKIAPKDESREFIREWAPGRNLEDYILSATIEAKKRPVL